MFLKQLLALAFFASLTLSKSLHAQWMPTNGPYGGTVYSMTVNGATLFAGSNGRVYASMDSGVHWTSISSGLPNFAIKALVVSNTTLFAGTDGNAIFRSMDNGTTWTRTSNGLKGWANVSALTTMGSRIYAGTDDSLFLSTDNGDTWRSVASGRIATLAVKDTTIFATIATPPYYFDHLYRSTDKGKNWKFCTIDTSSSFVNALAVRGSYIFAGTPNGVYRSSNDGKDWSESVWTGANVFAIAAEGSNVMAGTSKGIYRSTNNGLSWMKATTDMPAWFHTQAFTTIGTKFFAGTNGSGVFRSIDSGNSWIPSNTGFSSALVYSLALSGPYLLAGTAGSGFFRTSDYGATWSNFIGHQGTSSDLNSILCLTTIGNSLFAGVSLPFDYASGYGIFRSDDNGSTWSNGESKGITGTRILSVASNGSEILAGTIGPGYKGESPGLFSSRDNGVSWERVLTGSNSYVSAIFPYNNYLLIGSGSSILRSNQIQWKTVLDLGSTLINTFAQSSSMLFAGTSSGVYRSTDNGANWLQSNSGIPSYSGIYCFASIGPNIFAGTGYGVYCSTDDGLTWHEAGLKNLFVHSLAIIGQELYAGVVNDVVWHAPVSEVIARSAVAKSESAKQELRIYPNPLSQSTTLSFTPEVSGFADISIVNQLGVEVARIFSGELDASEHTYVWSKPANLPEGVYECVIRMNGKAAHLTLVLQR